MAGMAFGKGKKGFPTPTPTKGKAPTKGGFPFAPKAPKAPGVPKPTLKGGGKVAKFAEGGSVRSQGLQSSRASRARDDDMEARYGSSEKGYQESAPQALPRDSKGSSKEGPRVLNMGEIARRQPMFKRGGVVKAKR